MTVRAFALFLFATITFSLAACAPSGFFASGEGQSEGQTDDRPENHDRPENQLESHSKSQLGSGFRSLFANQLEQRRKNQSNFFVSRTGQPEGQTDDPPESQPESASGGQRGNMSESFTFGSLFETQRMQRYANQFAAQPLNQIDPATVMGPLIGGAVMGLSASAFGGGLGQTLIIAGGALTGAYVGSLYMERLEDRDRQRAHNAAQLAHTFPVGQASPWRNPSGKTSGSTTPILEGIDDKGRFCRQYQHIVTTNGHSRQEYATLCLGSDGRWRRAP